MNRPTDPISEIRWLAVKNASGGTIPSYAVMKVTGYEDDSGAFTVDQPDADSMSPSELMINGPGTIADGEYGAGTKDYPVLASVGSGSPGDSVGTATGSWSLDAAQTGFTLWQTVSSSLAVVVAEGGGSPSSECTLPTSATELAELSNAEDTPENNLAHWTTADVLQITLSGECCYVQFVRKECKDDGTGIISKRYVLHGSSKFKVSAGPTVDGDTSPESWMDARADACADMGDI